MFTLSTIYSSNMIIHGIFIFHKFLRCQYLHLHSPAESFFRMKWRLNFDQKRHIFSESTIQRYLRESSPWTLLPTLLDLPSPLNLRLQTFWVQIRFHVKSPMWRSIILLHHLRILTKTGLLHIELFECNSTYVRKLCSVRLDGRFIWLASKVRRNKSFRNFWVGLCGILCLFFLDTILFHTEKRIEQAIAGMCTKTLETCGKINSEINNIIRVNEGNTEGHSIREKRFEYLEYNIYWNCQMIWNSVLQKNSKQRQYFLQTTHIQWSIYVTPQNDSLN